MLNILTLSWDGTDRLAKLHDSLIPSLQGVPFHWFVRENGSKDNTVAMIQKWQQTNPNIILYQHPNNSQNFSQGCNQLFQLASPADQDYIMLLNNDVVFQDTQSIHKMLAILDRDEEVGMVGARLLYANDQTLQHAGVVFVPSYQTPTHFRARQPSDAHAQSNRVFQVITGAVCITRAELYANCYQHNKSGIAGMDEGYHWAFDDVDLCLAIRYKMKKQVVYCGETNITHEESASLKKNPANKLFLSSNLSRLFGKWKGRYSIDSEIYANNPKHNLYTTPKDKQ